MKTGIELIAEERQEQLTKHNRSVQSDVDFNTENQILSAIMLIVSNLSFQRGGIKMPKDAFEDLRPEGWGREICWKMLDKPEIGQLQIIGAFAAAEIDRLRKIEFDKAVKDMEEGLGSPSECTAQIGN